MTQTKNNKKTKKKPIMIKKEDGTEIRSKK